jgi:hypothetical protein
MSIEVTYKGHMGNDLTVVNAARVSFGKESEWDYEESDGYSFKQYIGRQADPLSCKPQSHQPLWALLC